MNRALSEEHLSAVTRQLMHYTDIVTIWLYVAFVDERSSNRFTVSTWIAELDLTSPLRDQTNILSNFNRTFHATS